MTAGSCVRIAAPVTTVLLLMMWAPCALAGAGAPATPGPLASQCTAPTWHGRIPDGGTATHQQMQAAEKVVEEFNTAVTGYTDCLTSMHRRLAANPNLSKPALDALQREYAQLNNAAVGNLERIVGAFNTQLHVWQHDAPEPALADAGTQPGTTPPHLLRGPSADDLGRCYSGVAREINEQAQVIAELTIAADGSVTDVEVPSGTPKYMAESVRCVVARLTFSPATKDGAPVASKAQLPLNFELKPFVNDAFHDPVLLTTRAQLAALRKSCTPPGFRGRGLVALKARITTQGVATDISVVRSGGSEQIDGIAECMLRGAQYVPATRGKDGPVEAVITFKIPVHS